MAEKKGFFKRLVEGLTKTRDSIVTGMDSIFKNFSSIDDDFYEEIEEILVMGDLGINATTAIIEDLKQNRRSRNRLSANNSSSTALRRRWMWARRHMSLKTGNPWCW